MTRSTADPPDSGRAGQTTRSHRCDVCGGHRLTHADVLWPDLVREWELAPAEVEYINVQQGTCCAACGANVRSMALARALLRFLRDGGTLDEHLAAEQPASPRILEVNEAGTLHARLARFPHYRFCQHPDIDLQNLPFADGAFDLIVHSDTLEHVPDPSLALREIHRVLRTDGATIFTVPTVIGRMSRSRHGLAPSYHGNPADCASDNIVHTEFGADCWAMAMSCGFQDVEIVSHLYPAGIAYIARK